MSDLFGPGVTVIALAVLAMLSAGGVAFALLYRKVRVGPADRRREAIADRSVAATMRSQGADQAIKRRRAVQETLRDLETREKARSKHRNSPPLDLRLEQAGLAWTRRTFFTFGAVAGLVVAMLAWFLGLPLYAVPLLAFAGALGLPFWIVNRMRKRRMKKFLIAFPGAVDIIVRGIKAGLPLNDCLRIIANEAQEPVRTEFKLIHERQAMGQSLGDAITRLPERVPNAEANFFTIVIAMQQRTGGNLAEALANLSTVLRERAKMRGKIKAMSSEAKASAYIIGALPVIVMALVYITSPDYIVPLFTDSIGHVILGASAIWMLIGIFVMRRMINFDF